MKNLTTAQYLALGIMQISDGNIDNEIEARQDDARKLNRTIGNLRDGIPLQEPFTLEIDFNTALALQSANNEQLEKLRTLKISQSPYKGITPRVSSKYEVGAIIYDSWGYEQTNIDFYCIVKKVNDTITLLPMTCKKSEETSFMSNNTEPGEINHLETPKRKTLKRNKAGEYYGFSLRNYSGGGWCSLYDGVPKNESHYA